MNWFQSPTKDRVDAHQFTDSGHDLFRMLPHEIQPYKVGQVGNRLTMVEAYRRDLDFWGNGERKLYHTVTKSLAEFLLKHCSCVRDNTFTFWCDIGCGAGFFLEGVSATLRALGPILVPSGVDVSPEALARCRKVFNMTNEFVEVDLDTYKRSEGHHFMPWINAQVVSFIDTFQYFKNYRATFKEILDGLQVGTVIVVADGMVRSNLRDYPKSVEGVACLGEWIDYSMAVTPRDPGNPKSKQQHLKYRVYQKVL